MVTYSTPSASSPSSSNPALSAPPTRSARRGLRYLREYTQSHLTSSSHDNSTSTSAPRQNPRNSLFRSSTYPASEQNGASDSGSAVATGGCGQDRNSRSDSLATGQTAVNTALVGISRLMARNRSGSTPHNARKEADTAPSNLAGYSQDQMPTIRLIPHQDPRSTRPSLAFPPTSRTLPHEDCVIRVGRYSERDSNPNPPPNIPSSAPIGFKSKVVSRRHCEFWCSKGQWYIKDVKSSSGTFLNHIRLSQPSVESRPWPVNDGDVVQLGIDFRGGEEMIFRCVKIRVECNRAWQKSLNNFNVTTHKRLRDLAKLAPKKDADTASTHSSECSICLMSIAPCQSLFVAPCSHVWHYKCIRPILNDHKTWPQFLCPNCRAVTDLEADVEDGNDEDWEDDDNAAEVEANNANTNETHEVVSDRALHNGAREDEDLATMSNRILTVRNNPGPAPPIPILTQPFSVPADLADISSPQNIIGRRNPSWTTARPTNSDSSLPKANDNHRRTSAFFRLPRPMTPTESTLQEQNITSNRLSSGQEATELLTSDGPLTPTNNAGPFVFDGSAGRAAGQRAVASLALETESTA